VADRMRIARDPAEVDAQSVKPAIQRRATTPSVDLAGPGHLDNLPSDSLLGLQQLAGNAGVAALVAPAQTPGPARPHIGPETEAVMHDQINQIVEMFQEMWLSASQEEKIVGFVETYANLDETYQKETGYAGTDNLDRFLFFLKIRSYLHSTFSSVGIEQTYNTYDQMWRELKDSRLERFKAIVAKSRKQATSGPEAQGPEAFDWAKLGKQEGMGAWGILKGISSGLGKVVDAGSDIVNWLPKKLGYDLEPLHYSEMIGDQFDEAGQAMFGPTWKKRTKPGEPEPQLTPEQKKKQEEEDRDNELFYGINPQQLGTAGGDVIFSLAMMSGGGEAKMASGFKTLLKAKGVAKGLKDIADKSQELFDIAGKVQELEGEDEQSFAARLLNMPEFHRTAWELALAIVETVLAGAGEGDETAKLVEKFIVPALKGNVTMAKAAKLVDIANDEKLKPEERKKATGEAMLEVIKDGTLLLGGFAAKKDKANAEEAAKAAEEKRRAEELAATVARQKNEPHMNVNVIALPEAGPTPEVDAPKPKAAGFEVDKVLVGDDAKEGGFKESTLKKLAMENWEKGGGNQLVKVVSAERGASDEVRGYVTELKYVAGRTPAEMERILGLPDGELAGGAVVHKLDGTPTADQFRLRAYTQLPAGKTYEPGEEYPPGLGAPQWELTAKVPVAEVSAVKPDEAYRPGSGAPGK
jgi:hypothetical protein